MKPRLLFSRFRAPTSEVSGSALVLVLLVTALLTTIAVSFLSTSRVEQMATRNFSRQNAASGFAELATQQAMGKIKNGFTVPDTSTTIITTQPGLIRQFVFAGGSPSITPIELFSEAGDDSLMVNLNNLENPYSPESDDDASSNQWTITGNASERINVPLEEIEDSTGTLIGRIAYYVDDEGAKLNLNQAVGSRDTINAAGRHPLDITAMAGANATILKDIIDGEYTESDDIKSWGHFFRPEQAVAAGVAATGQVPSLSTAVSSATNPLSSYTPWGSPRFFINELPIDSSGVDTIYDALTDQGLNDIFQGNFQDKYTELGLKQTAANYLQMRLPDVRTPSDSFTYLGGLLGANATTDLDDRIPINYQARSFFPIISEFALFAQVSHPGGTDPSNKTWYNKRSRFIVFVVVEVDNPYDQDYPGGGWLEVLMDKASYTLRNGVHIWGNLGPQGEEAGDTWTNTSTPTPGESYYNGAYDESGTSLLSGAWNNFAAVTLPAIPKFSKKRFIFMCVHNWNLTADQENYLATNNLLLKDFQPHPDDSVDVKVKRIVLYAGAANVDGTGLGTEPEPLSIRDWVTGDEMENEGFDKTIPFDDYTTNQWKLINNSQKPTAQTFQRSDARIKRSRAMVQTGALASPWYFADQTMGSANNSTPSQSAGDTIPGDPSPSDSPTEALWPNPATPNSMADPILLGVANPGQVSSTSPADLGKVLTPYPWRTLRMQVQPASEAVAGLIPDWAMLDAMSFGPEAAGAGILDNFQPVNLNGQFHVPSGPQPAPRNIGIKALVKVLDNAPNKLADPMGGPDIDFADPITFMGNTIADQNDAETIADNIGEMNWSNASQWSSRRAALGFPSDSYLLPSEVIEIAGVADEVDQTDYTNSTSHFKWNEGRASALLPAVTTRSSFFTIYAYAQALDKTGTIDSEALTKTLVEVEVETPATDTTPTTYKVKKLYTQPIPLGQ